MTYHISLGQAPLGLSGQTDTEQGNRMSWSMKHNLNQNMYTDTERECDVNGDGHIQKQAHQHNMECNREFGGSCAALSPWQNQSRWASDWHCCPWWSTAGFQAVVCKMTAWLKWEGHRNQNRIECLYLSYIGDIDITTATYSTKRIFFF